MINDFITLSIAALAVLVAVTEHFLSRREHFFRSLVAGSKEEVAVTARSITEGRKSPLWRRRPLARLERRRVRKMVRGLVHAAIFERSGRSRANIYRALSSLADRDPRYAKFFANELELAEDLINDYWLTESLDKALKQLGRLQLVYDNARVTAGSESSAGLLKMTVRDSTRSGSLDGIYALDLHEDLVRSYPCQSAVRPSEKATEITIARANRPERGEESAPPCAKFSIEKSETARRTLATALAQLIMTAPPFASVKTIVAVPGHDTDFAAKLAADVANITGHGLLRSRYATNEDLCAGLVQAPIEQSGGRVPHRQPVVISGRVPEGHALVIDDVYRTGTTVGLVAAKVRANHPGVVVSALTVTLSRTWSGRGKQTVDSQSA